MQNYYASRKWKRLPQSDCPAYSPVREAKTGISSVSPAYRGIKMGWLWGERPLITPAIPLGGGGGGGVSNDWCINPLFKFMQKTAICFSVRVNACTLVPTVFRWHEKMEFKYHQHFSFSHDIEKQVWIFLFVFRFRLTLKNGFELRISFFVFASLWKTNMNFVFA